MGERAEERPAPEVRRLQPSPTLTREEFERRLARGQLARAGDGLADLRPR